MSLVFAALLSACARAPDTPTFRSFDLDVAHPSPYATFVAVSPGASGAKLPGLNQLKSRDFNRYLVALIGCSVDPYGETHVIGDRRIPAGYMVPIVCLI